MTRRTGPISAVVDILEDRCEGLCERCGERPAVHTHHRLPRRMGGTRRPEVNLPPNLLRLDLLCHDWIENNRTVALDLGFLLHDGDYPRREKVLWRGEERYLDNKGGFGDPPTCPLGCAVWTSDDEPCDCEAT